MAAPYVLYRSKLDEVLQNECLACMAFTGALVSVLALNRRMQLPIFTKDTVAACLTKDHKAGNCTFTFVWCCDVWQ